MMQTECSGVILVNLGSKPASARPHHQQHMFKQVLRTRMTATWLWRFCTGFFVVTLLLASPRPSCSETSSPIVIVPGILGNQLEGKLNKSTVPHYLCERHTDDYITLWLAVTDLLPDGEVDCLSDNLRLVYDAETKQYNSAPGVTTRIPGFGDTYSVEYLDPNTKWFSVTNYFHAMVQHFVDKGYTRGKDIVAAPYDWRYSPKQYVEQGYFSRLKDLIESAYSNGGDKPVVLIAHSMGAPTSLYFLTKIVNQAWKEKYLRHYITISGVWHGTAKSAKAFTSGDNEGIWIVPQSQGRAGTRTYPSTAWLLPYPSDTWTKDDVLVVTPKRNYTAWDYKALFDDMKYSRGYDMFEEIMNLTGSLPPPNITMHCLYGTDMKTPIQFHYGPGEFPDTQPKTINGNGDGTVNIDSLMACSRWKDQQKYNVTLKGFSGVEHVHTIKTDSIIQFVDGIVYSESPH